MIPQEREPRWPRRAVAWLVLQVARHRALRHSHAQLQQFAVNPRRTPGAVLGRHPLDEIAGFLTRTGPSNPSLPSGAKSPVQSEAPRCHPTTVSGFTMMSALVHLAQTRRSMTQKNRSTEVSRRRGWRRDRTMSCCRSARFSSARSPRKRQKARNQRSTRASLSGMVPVVARTVCSEHYSDRLRPEFLGRGGIVASDNGQRLGRALALRGRARVLIIRQGSTSGLTQSPIGLGVETSIEKGETI